MNFKILLVLLAYIVLQGNCLSLSHQAVDVSTNAEFENLVNGITTPYLLFFYADWSGSSKKMGTILEKS
jgi:thioredoxin-like negative regulator of GroEL